jgi:rhodanese-related sulfurtransferase
MTQKPIHYLVIGAIAGALLTLLTINIAVPGEIDENSLISEYYAIENAVSVSPHGLRAQMSKGQTDHYVLVDLRSEEEYVKEHVVTAVNIPAYKDANNSAYDETERIVNSFKEIIAKNPNKDIITYCYSTACMTSRKIGLILAENNIYVKHLNIGWNEWRYAWDMWNHDSETPSEVEDYVVSGTEPGTPPETGLAPICTEGEFGC